MGDTQVPVVELKSSLRAYLSGDPTSERDVEVAQRIICEIGDSLALGFVSVTGHGVDPDLLERAYDVAREVFALLISKNKRMKTRSVVGSVVTLRSDGAS